MAFGDLTVRCPDRHSVTVDVRARGLELGDDAWLFSSPGAAVVAVSIHGDDGGEDCSDHFLNTVVLDIPALCAGGTGLAGPLPGRNVGP